MILYEISKDLSFQAKGSMLPFQWALGLCRQKSEVLAKIPVLHGYIPMESQEPGEHGIPIWEFLEINSHFRTFLHIHIILRWANKIRRWLPIAGNTKISPGEPC